MQFDIFTVIQQLHLTSIFKVGILLITALYLIFLFIIYKQVHLMNNVVRQAFSGALLEFFAFLLLLAGLAIFLIAIAIL
ncbi:MAG TPA: DUF5657 family protein [Candidatus Saccharimonadales bacterium]|nr:DUF5657 family protein [Candidatus Saccharimonadales bacterium]